MFEDITNKKELLKSTLGVDLITKLNANVIAKKIVEKHKYNSCVELLFNINLMKDGTTMLTLKKDGRIEEYVLIDGDTLILTHKFDVNL